LKERLKMTDYYPTALSYEEEYASQGITTEELNNIISFLKGRIKTRRNRNENNN